MFLEEVKFVLILLMILVVCVIKVFVGVWDVLDENGFRFVEVLRVLVVVIDCGDVLVYNYSSIVYLGVVIIEEVWFVINVIFIVWVEDGDVLLVVCEFWFISVWKVGGVLFGVIVEVIIVVIILFKCYYVLVCVDCFVDILVLVF